MSDPCECLFNHETMMRRLLSLLNDAQTDCTDSDCIASNSLPDAVGTASGGGNMMLIAMLWGLLAMVMFFFRPSSMRGDSNSRNAQLEGKPSSVNDNDNNEPPAPDVH